MVGSLGEADLEKITEILVSNLNARGEVINTDISELHRLTNLKSLGLKGFDLNEKVIDIINRFPELVQLKLYECSSKEPVSINADKLQSLILEYCRLSDLSKVNLPENVLIIGGGIVDVSKMQNCELLKDLEIKSSEIINSYFLKEIKGLKSLNVDGSTLDNEDVLRKLKERNISVSHEYEYHPMR